MKRQNKTVITSAQTQQAFRRASGLRRIALLLSEADSSKRVAHIIISEGFKVLGAHSGDISLLNSDGSYQVISQKGYSKDFLKQFPQIPSSAPLLTSQVLKTKKPYFIKRVDELHKKYHVAKSFILTSGALSAALIPLLIHGEIIGIIQFTFKTIQDFSQEDKIFMSTLADLCAHAFERVRAQEDVRESKELLEVILHNTGDGIVVVNPENVISYVNDSFAKFVGVNQSIEIGGKQLDIVMKNFTIMNELGAEVLLSDITTHRQNLSSKQRSVLLRFVNRKTKTFHWFIIKSTEVYDNQHQHSLTILTLQDVTQVKELDQKKDEFISMASHELKTPLTSLKLFLQILSSQIERTPHIVNTAHVKKIEEQTERLEKLVYELLDVSRIQNGKLALTKEEFRIDELTKNTAEELQMAAPYHKIIITKLDPVTVSADRFRIYQVLTNLLTNAIKYSPHGKKIAISVEKNSHFATVQVQDQGVGISKEHQQKIFDRFYQVSTPTSKKYAGLGMGLYISSQVIQNHGGKIWVESKKGKGSSFYFKLPLSDG